MAAPVRVFSAHARPDDDVVMSMHRV